MKKNDKQTAAKSTKNPETNQVESPSATAEVIEKNSEAEESETEQPDQQIDDEANSGAVQTEMENSGEPKGEDQLSPVEKTDEGESAQKVEGQESPGNNLKLPEVNAISATAEVIRSSATEVIEDKRLVRVLIQYPEGYEGPRHLKDGQEYDVSPESADLFIEKGFGTKVNKTN